MKKFCSSKGAIIGVKRQATEYAKIFQYPKQRFISRICIKNYYSIKRGKKGHPESPVEKNGSKRQVTKEYSELINI